MASSDFKIVIAGGGIAGLVLANMLEKFDLDYVLLESHSEIAPPVGASIGMFPNGLRILDQLGCYGAIGVVGTAASNLYSVWDLRRLGYIRSSQAVKAAVSVVVGEALVGSGATWAGLWYWREDKIAHITRLKQEA
ncbi:hypothetical protein QQX98_008034 [Neonectria punicea]|uniref:FAD-binding domain-containing protein n=1 Tax=Neonectria punicea TaxID=979145 RepID=A0ABR1GXD5_9HYPO